MLVEVVNGVVTVTGSKIFSNQTPYKTLNNNGILFDSNSLIFNQNILEVTFSIHESFLTECKEWMVKNLN